MRKYLFILTALFAVAVASVAFWSFNGSVASNDPPDESGEPDLPGFVKNAKNQFSKKEFHLRRVEGIALKRGLVKGQPFDPSLRPKAIREMEKQDGYLNLKS